MNFTVTLSEAWDVIRRPFQASPLPRAALLRLLPVVLSAILLGQPAATVADEACPLPTPAGVECRGVGSRVEFDMLAPPAEPGLTFPRLNNVVLQVSWEPRKEQPHAAEEAASLEHSAYRPPQLIPAERQLTLSQTPRTWTIGLPDTITYPARIVLELASAPLFPPQGHACTAAADGSITLPARHAVVQGEKLQFEPLPHKNTVGYWVNAADTARWFVSTETAGAWEVHVLQGCGSGQGGSRVRFTLGEATLAYNVVETGHFQNFRWHRVGTVELPQGERHVLEVACLEKRRAAVMDIRQIRLVPTGGPRETPLTISDTEPDVLVPPLTSAAAAAGRRVLMRLPEPPSQHVYHTVSLPTDWRPDGRFPVLAEWAGNGPFRSAAGDTNSGRVEDAALAQGLAGTDGAIVLGLPYLDNASDQNVSMWWGTPPSHDAAATLAYAKAAIRDVCGRWGGDAERVVLAGFSRGSIACNALGLADDEIAGLWQAAVCFSHYDGLRSWPFAGSSAAAARERLGRLHGRPQLIMAESVGEPGAASPALAATRAFLAAAAADGDFRFLETGFLNHDDDWALRPGPARREARRWLSEVLGQPPREESL
ncbi:MAG: hypothetical protein ISQ70_12775 [Pirellulales bacterium]|nr:hypothetical protein [Pirellulales bacterium]